VACPLGLHSYTKKNLFVTNFIKDCQDDPPADSHSIVNTQKNHLCQIFNVYGVNNVRQTATQRADPLVSEPFMIMRN
jgi:hypothetical protein